MCAENIARRVKGCLCPCKRAEETQARKQGPPQGCSLHQSWLRRRRRGSSPCSWVAGQAAGSQARRPTGAGKTSAWKEKGQGQGQQETWQHLRLHDITLAGRGLVPAPGQPWDGRDNICSTSSSRGTAQPLAALSKEKPPERWGCSGSPAQNAQETQCFACASISSAPRLEKSQRETSSTGWHHPHKGHGLGEPCCREPAGHWDGGEGCPHLGRAVPSQCWQGTGPSASQCGAGDLAAPSAGAGAEGSRGGKGWGKGERVGGTEKTPERKAEMNKQCSSGPWGLRDTHTLLEGPHLHPSASQPGPGGCGKG